MNLSDIRREILSQSNPKKAKALQQYFKTGIGEYGEGDIFLGIMVPESRKIASRYYGLPENCLKELLNSKIHEERLISLLILVSNYHKYPDMRDRIFSFYLENTPCINNWDLVDISAPKIVGRHLFDKSREILYDLAGSGNIWERRISIISTSFFIQDNDFADTLNISGILLNDPHDLIHKAVGWMLREVGKKDFNVLENFLRPIYKKMPRTMLRYAIEKFPEKRRKDYLVGLA